MTDETKKPIEVKTQLQTKKIKDKLREIMLKIIKSIGATIIEYKKAIIMIQFIVIAGLIITVSYMPKYYANIYSLPDMSDATPQEKIQRLQELTTTYEKFKAMSGKQLNDLWNTKFDGWTYDLDGDPKYQKADCVGAINIFYTNVLGSNIKLENVVTFTTRVENLEKRGLTSFRKNINEVKSGDLIIFKLSPTNWHIGMVIDTTTTGLIRFDDMGVRFRKAGQDYVKFGDYSIKCIVETTHSIWIGDLMQSFNEK